MKSIVKLLQWLLFITFILASLQGVGAEEERSVDNDNLLHNYGFTDVNGAVPDGWTLIGAGGIVATLVNNIANTQAMSLESQDPNNPSIFFQAVNGTPNTAYSLTFWGYRNTSTQITTSPDSHNLTVSFGRGSWNVYPPDGVWQKYYFNGTGIGPDDKVQWSGYDATGAQTIVGYPCYFLTEEGDDGSDHPSTTSHPGSTGLPGNLSATSHMSKSQKIGAIVGGVVGGLIFVAAIVACLLWRRRKNNSKPVKISSNAPPTPEDESKSIAQPNQISNAPWAVPISSVASTGSYDPAHQINDAPWAIPADPPAFYNPAHPSFVTASPVPPMSDVPSQTSLDVYGTSNIVGTSSIHSTAMDARPTSSLTARSTDGTRPFTPSSPAPAFRSLPLPEYGTSVSRTLSTTSRMTPQGVPIQSMGVLLTADDEIGRWAADHRSSVSLDLEQKLRGAHYRPTDNPKEISDAVWNERYGVGHFELKRIQELYEEQLYSDSAKAKEMHGSGQGGAPWRPSEATQ